MEFDLTIPEHVAKMVREVRENAGLSICDVIDKLEAHRVGRTVNWDRSKISRYETGESKMPAEAFLCICDVLRVKASKLSYMASKKRAEERGIEDGVPFERTEEGRLALQFGRLLDALMDLGRTRVDSRARNGLAAIELLAAVTLCATAGFSAASEESSEFWIFWAAAFFCTTWGIVEFLKSLKRAFSWPRLVEYLKLFGFKATEDGKIERDHLLWRTRFRRTEEGKAMVANIDLAMTIHRMVKKQLAAIEVKKKAGETEHSASSTANAEALNEGLSVEDMIAKSDLESLAARSKRTFLDCDNYVKAWPTFDFERRMKIRAELAYELFDLQEDANRVLHYKRASRKSGGE